FILPKKPANMLKNILPKAIQMIKNGATSGSATFELTATGARKSDASTQAKRRRMRLTAGLIAGGIAAVALLICIGLGLGPLPSIIIVLFAWITTAMSAQSVGQTGIDPMEIFGLIVLLIVAAVSNIPQVQLFFVAGIIAVACGLAGDVMNDFKAGHVLGTDPKAQWIGQAIGGVLGAFVAVAVMFILVQAYGADAFGLGGSFVSAQASVVATMVTGIPSIPSFIIGLVVGCGLYLLGLPVMMLGLGIYLPFYMSFTAFLGAMAKVVYDQICKRRRAKLSPEEAEAKEKAQGESGLIVASGLLGGESIVGVLVAFASVAMGLGL
ncbi:MAG: OPT/YSL family transporter, partial [Raoultibacter sp.]